MTRLLLLLWFGQFLAWAQTTPILIDTDAGSDDFMAIALLLSDRTVSIDAVTIVNGVAHIDVGARNIERLLDLAGRSRIPVFRGRSAPLRGKAEFPAEWRKIADDLPGVELPAPSRAPESKHAADYLVERLRKGPLRILALGPLTNIAEALERDRSIAANIREIVIMGGALKVPGNLEDGGLFHTKNTTAEWNIFMDPLAASIVFRSGVPIRLIALDATNKVPIGLEFLSELQVKAHSPLGRAVKQVLESERPTIVEGMLYVWDPLAAAALLKPAVVKTVRLHIEVRQDPPEEGRTVATPGQPNAQVAVDADAAAFRALFIESFATDTP